MLGRKKFVVEKRSNIIACKKWYIIDYSNKNAKVSIIDYSNKNARVFIIDYSNKNARVSIIESFYN